MSTNGNPKPGRTPLERFGSRQAGVDAWEDVSVSVNAKVKYGSGKGG